MMMMMHSSSARTRPTVVVDTTKVRYCFCCFKFSLCAFVVVVVYVVLCVYYDRFLFVWALRYFLMDRKRWALEPPRDESKRSSFTSSSLRSSLNPVLLFFERERERERERESAFERRRRRRAREYISIKISFTNLLSYVNLRQHTHFSQI